METKRILRMVFKKFFKVSKRFKLLNGNLLSCLIHFITYKCNLFCSFCCIHSKLNAPIKELTYKEISKVVNSLPIYKKLDMVILTGGEPFLKEDLVNIIMEYSKVTDNVAIPTNGKDTNVIINIIQKVVKSQNINLYIGLSIDGFKKGHDELRNEHGLWTKVINTAEGLKSIETRYNNLNVSVQILLLPSNIKTILNLIQYIQNVLEFPVELEIVRNSPYNNVIPNRITLTEEIHQLLPELQNVYIKNSLLRPARRNFYHWGWKKLLWEISGEKNNNLLKCVAGKTIGVLYPTGDVSICEQKKPFANLFDFHLNFEQLWHSGIADQTRKEVKGCFCSHGCFIYQNLNFNLYSKILSLLGKV